MQCVLCDLVSTVFFTAPDGRQFLKCPQCDLRFLHPQWRLSPLAERQRYDFHENDPQNPGYQKFVMPLVERATENHSPGAEGLDFGSGVGSAIALLLKQGGFEITSYDPFYFPNLSSLSRFYDFIVSVEVAEHFYQPAVEFARLRSLIRPGGSLGLMTSIYRPEIDFAGWYYKNDPTHVCFYSLVTLNYIQKTFDFTRLELFGDRTIWLRT